MNLIGLEIGNELFDDLIYVGIVDGTNTTGIVLPENGPKNGSKFTHPIQYIIIIIIIVRSTGWVHRKR